MDERDFLENELNRKLYQLQKSETERSVILAISDARLKMLAEDIDVLQKRLMKLK